MENRTFHRDLRCAIYFYLWSALNAQLFFVGGMQVPHISYVEVATVSLSAVNRLC